MMRDKIFANVVGMVACGRDSGCILKWKAYVSTPAAVITRGVKILVEAEDISLFFKYELVAVKSTSSTSTSVTIYRKAQPQICWPCNSVFVCDCQDFTMFGETFQMDEIISLLQLSAWAPVSFMQDVIVWLWG